MLKIALSLIITALCFGCAKISVQKDRSDLRPLPVAENSETRLAYYKSHSIQGVDHGMLLIDGAWMNPKTIQNGPGYVDSYGHPLAFVCANPDTQKTVAVLAVPAGAAAGAAVVFVGGLVVGSPGKGILDVMAEGAGVGALLGLGTMIYLMSSAEARIDKSNAKVSVSYNRRLWKALNFRFNGLSKEAMVDLKLSY